MGNGLEESWAPEPTGQVAREALAVGRGLLERFGLPVVSTGLSTVVLPAGTFSLLVLGIPIPVFESQVGAHHGVESWALDHLTGLVLGHVHNGHRLGLHSFTRCFGTTDLHRAANWFPRFARRLDGRRPAVLGAQLVTLYPLSTDDAMSWPHGPARIVDCVHHLESALPGFYDALDRVLETSTGRYGPMTRDFAASGSDLEAP